MHAYFIWETRASKAYATSTLKYTQGLATSDASASYSSGKLHLPVKETPVLNAALIYISPIFFFADLQFTTPHAVYTTSSLLCNKRTELGLVCLLYNIKA